jgi:hypothetical protein
MAAMSGIECVRESVPLADRTWFKLGGPAQYFAEPGSIDELQAVVERSHDEGVAVEIASRCPRPAQAAFGGAAPGVTVSVAAQCTRH